MRARADYFTLRLKTMIGDIGMVLCIACSKSVPMSHTQIKCVKQIFDISFAEQTHEEIEQKTSTKIRLVSKVKWLLFCWIWNF